MKIELLQLLKHEGTAVPLRNVEFSPEQLEIDGDDAALAEPVVISGEFTNLGSGVISFHAEGTYMLKLQCARCLREFSRRFPCVIQEVFREPEDWEDFLTDGMIDVTAIVRHGILLSMEPRYLCREDCKGLCPQCGQDLNQDPCRCEPETDPRLSVLKQLLKDDK